MSTKGNKSETLKTVIKITIPVEILAILITLACAILRKRRLKHAIKSDDEVERLESLRYKLSTIKAATDDFSDSDKLGQGGFGSIYKVTNSMPKHGNTTKWARNCSKEAIWVSTQGEGEFKNEILLVAKLQHRTLVSLIGFCSEGTEKILVYELLSNGSLDSLIFGMEKLEKRNSCKSHRQCTKEQLRNDIMRCMHIGLLCVQENAADRSTTASVVLMLSSHSLSLQQPSQPAFLIYSNTDADIPVFVPDSQSQTATSEESTEYTGERM
ncbi:conserved hypothetical protein [Ricinus communis]|uniref:Protein kinase domain-containing protein n=1 Tax=Ricinus communis TaxID=3988 RepID=B9RAQ9_RICCO|nr:conserved hypothetical protein [Ricinus communis]